MTSRTMYDRYARYYDLIYSWKDYRKEAQEMFAAGAAAMLMTVGELEEEMGED